MSEKTLNPNDDQAVGAALLAEVPARSDDYWSRIDARLSEASDAKVTAIDAGRIREISIGDDEDKETRQSLRRWPIAALVATVVLLGGFLLAQRGLGRSGQVETGANDGSPVVLTDLPGPAANSDHWNAVYGVWDCSADDGAGAWLPKFDSNLDEVGIHSHRDGLISIHPFVEEAAGVNATFSHFAASMQFTLTDDALTLDDGRILAEGTECGGEPAVLQMLRWQDARELEADPLLAPRVIASNFGAERFYNDLEVWTLALAPVGADIPLPPQDRFDVLAAWWWPPEDTRDLDYIQPTPVPGNAVIEVPMSDAYVSVRLVAVGEDADAVVEEFLATLPREIQTAGELRSGSAIQRVATASSTRLQVDLLTYETVDEPPPPGVDPTMVCKAVAPWSNGCSRADQPIVNATQLDTKQKDDNEMLVAWNASAEAFWFVVELDSGFRIVAEIAEGASFAAWRLDQGTWARAELLDVDHNVLWSRANE